jgi:hypothetical protein
MLIAFVGCSREQPTPEPEETAEQTTTATTTATTATTVTTTTAATEQDEPSPDPSLFWHMEETHMSLEVLEAMNPDIMPQIEFNDDGTIDRISDSGRIGSRVSPFPVFTEEDATFLLDIYAPLFGMDEDVDIRLTRDRSDSRSNIFNFGQFHNGIRVSEAGWSVKSCRETGNVTTVINSYVANLNIETTPQITVEEAVQIAMSEHDIIGLNENGETELYIFYDRNSNAVPQLFWEFYVTATYEANIRKVIVNAITGEIIETRPARTTPS